jgi:hypothetical protein
MNEMLMLRLVRVERIPTLPANCKSHVLLTLTGQSCIMHSCALSGYPNEFTQN